MVQRLPLTYAQLLTVLTLPLVVYFGYGAARKAIEIQELRGRAETIRREIDVLQNRSVDLRMRVEYLRTDEFLERAAREQLGMIKPTEMPIVVIVADAVPAPAQRPPEIRGAARTNPQLWWDFFFGEANAAIR